MNPKAKIEWSHSGERAGASTIGPAQATRLATASCSSSFCHWRSSPPPPGDSALPPSWGLPFLGEFPFPTPTRSGSGPCSGPSAFWNQNPGRAWTLQVPTLLALLLSLIILMEDSAWCCSVPLFPA